MTPSVICRPIRSKCVLKSLGFDTQFFVVFKSIDLKIKGQELQIVALDLNF
jgi:hypothetical protein